MQKRGLSGIVATLLIILLVIVAVGIVWVVVRGVLQEGASEVGFETLTADVGVKKAYVEDGVANVLVKRGTGEGNVVGVKIVLSDGENSEVIEEFIDLEKLEEKMFSYDLSALGIPGANEVIVAPIIELESGEQTLGQANTQVLVGGTGSGGGNGGGGGTGGTGAVCGNNIIEGDEVCDGIELAGEDCITQGYSEGTLACLPDCTGFDTSSCTGGLCTDGETELCPLQQGVCAGSYQTCTASAWPGCDYSTIIGYEAIELSCSDGIDNDCDGLIDIEDETCTLILGNAVIDSVWPGSAPRYFDSPNLPKNNTEMQTYVGKWVTFTGVPARVGLCFQVYVAGYQYNVGPPVYDMSHLGFASAITNPNLSPTETFSVYKTFEACESA